MKEWSLAELFKSLHSKIDEELRIAKTAIEHPGTKGDTSEAIWIELLKTYLPNRYQVCGGHVVDSEGVFSDQIDIVIFDRQYSPFIFDFMGAKVVPAESVYAIFEAKQVMTAAHIEYAKAKITSVRQLTRTSLPIPTATGTAEPKQPQHIIGGILAFESSWNPELGDTLVSVLQAELTEMNRLDIGCVSAHGLFRYNADKKIFETVLSKSAATKFLLELMLELQSKATVPMIDITAYSRWLED